MNRPTTTMHLVNRAWRIETKALRWHRGWKKGRNQWKEFCRRNAEIIVEARQESGKPPLEGHVNTYWHINEN